MSYDFKVLWRVWQSNNQKLNITHTQLWHIKDCTTDLLLGDPVSFILNTFSILEIVCLSVCVCACVLFSGWMLVMYDGRY